MLAAGPPAQRSGGFPAVVGRRDKLSAVLLELRFAREAMVDIVEAKRLEILDLARRHGVTRVRVFGSMARGDAGPQSDVDLLVEVGPDPSPWFPGGLVADLEKLLGRRVQVITERALDELLRERVLREAVSL